MKSSAITLQRQDVRQAVVYVDAYSPNFRPFTLSTHMAFTPVLNVPAIDFTIELLIASSIEEVYLVSSKYDEKLKTYIDNNKWTKIKKVAITLFISESCLSLGDALREIYAKGSIKSDFILVNGLVISNLCLKPLLEIHKKRRQKDKVDTLMTLVFLQTKGRVPYDIKRRFALAMDRQCDRILYFSPLKSSRIQIPMEVMDKTKQVAIACDLWHSDVSICSPQVPQFFADNFDYQNIPDFANDILVNEEILGSQIHVHIEETSYCFSLSNLPMYYRLSIDLLNDWFYPATPGKWRHNIALTDTHLYELRSRGGVYLPNDPTQYRIAENSVLQQDVLIGAGTDIDSDSFITRSIIGTQCKIGRNTQIKNSIICDSVVIGNECMINNSVLGRGVVLHDGVHLKNGSSVNQNIIVGPYLQFPGPTIFHDSSDELKDFCMSIKRKNRPWPADAIIALENSGHGFYVKLRFVEPQAKPLSTDQYDSSTLEVPITSSYKSCGSECLLYTPPLPTQQSIPLGHVLSADNVKKTEGARRKNSQSSVSLGNESDTSSTTSTSSADKHGDYDDSDASSTTCSLPEPGQIGSDLINTLENDDLALAPNFNSTRADISSFEDAHIPDDLKAFYSELYESFQRCEEDAIPLKNLILEINSSKHAYNVNLQDLWFCIAKIVFTPTTAIAFGDQDRIASFNHYKKGLNYYNDLLNNYFKTQESQVVFLSTFVESLTQQGEHQPALQANFSKLLHHMYHTDVVTEEAIMLWFKSNAKKSLPSNLYVHAEAFVKWLEEAEEDSGDED